MQPPSKKLTGARETMDRIGLQLLQDAKAQTLSGEKDYDWRDLLSLLVKSNMSQKIPERQRLSDAVVFRPYVFVPVLTTYHAVLLTACAELPTFFVAGHETTCCNYLGPLRARTAYRSSDDAARGTAEHGYDAPSVDAFNGLPYLEKVVREVMRVHSPVLFTDRMATQDDILPLGGALTCASTCGSLSVVTSTSLGTAVKSQYDQKSSQTATLRVLFLIRKD
ncbi:hypothetical protein B0H16DRAFT_1472184 [Mycena metata]|uniref:Cytochrome P450 n=1 Tax=Mycena metata TaxID=1033252 RepID=A0AAD7MND7_9AGAR|nr:hypothetical protein B0H16DRAFT_1472184 [Mycena metata]